MMGDPTPDPVGRPPDPANVDRVTTTLRIDRDLLARVDAAAEARMVGRNWLLCRLVSEGMDALVPVEELSFTRAIGDE